MADDFFKEEEEQKQVAEQLEKIKLGDKEYTQDELQSLVGLGEQTREIETKLNTKIDKVYPAFTKTSQEKAALEKRITEMEEARNRPQNFDEDQVKQAREAARKIGIVTKDDFATFMRDNFRPFYQQERQAERLLDECKDLEKQMDGSNGQPKFKTEEVLQWMADNGAKSPKQAYKMMYEKEIDEFKSRELGKAKRPGLVTETGTDAGGKEPSKVPVTRDNIEQLMKEALGQGD